MLSVIIPTLNERESLEKLFPEIEKALRGLSGAVEVIIVDDASTDGTVKYVEQSRQALKFPLRIIVRAERGLATAVIRGIAEASGDVICVIDADLSHPPSLIPKLYEAVSMGTDIAVGSRYTKGGGVENWPFHRKIFSYIPTLLARPISKSIKDPLSGFFCVKKSALTGIKYNVAGYKILLEIIVKGRINKAVEVPFIFRNRGVGASKLNGAIAMQYFWHLGLLYIYNLNRLFR